MANTIMRGYDVEHPEPHPGAASRTLLFTALLGGPIAWMLQLCIGYGLTAQTCFPREAPHPGGLAHLPWVWPTSLALNLLALAVALAATGLSCWIWRRTRNHDPGAYAGLIEAGEGRTRYLAVWGIWLGLWFAVDIAFNTIAMFEVATCGN